MFLSLKNIAENIKSRYIYFSDTYIQKLRRQYSDARGRRQIHQLRDDLNDVQRIMMDNIDDVLQRGTALSGIIYYMNWEKLRISHINKSHYLLVCGF